MGRDRASFTSTLAAAPVVVLLLAACIGLASSPQATTVPAMVMSARGELEAVLGDAMVSDSAALCEWDRRSDFAAGTAIEFLRETIRAHPGEVTLLAVGPLTNVGVLFATDPALPALLKRLVLMCGRFFRGTGGEWNAGGDPHATAIAYGNGCQSRPPRHVSFGLDVTTRCTMDADACREKFAAKALQPVRDFAEVWFRKRDRICFHDPLAAACVFQGDLCRYRDGRVTVSLTPPTMGWTVFDAGAEDDPKPHTVACEVDPDAFFAHYFDVVT